MQNKYIVYTLKKVTNSKLITDFNVKPEMSIKPFY